MKLIVKDGLKPIDNNSEWHRGFITIEIFYFLAIQLDVLNVYFGIERPIDKLKLIKIIPNYAIFDNTTGFIIPGAKVNWIFKTVQKFPTYNPIGVGRVLNGGISGKNDQAIIFNDSSIDYNIEIDYFSDSSPNFFYLTAEIFLPVSYLGTKLEAKIMFMFDYKMTKQ